ncbi:acetyl-CoA carboxylase biotin carboxylase subunit family protein [Amycolatopsis sp. NPDC059021]|uniref:ATP-grasp domain-containing protein n=1 Tax=Amycolatopsis sp. NPDC059021 TaxID=3346704 RepID=UPI00366CDC30
MSKANLTGRADPGTPGDRETNVFVIGLDEENARVLERLSWAGTYRFHEVLSPGQLRHGDIGDLMYKARSILDGFDGEIDAIVTYGGFPAPSMVSMLCREYGLPSVSLEAVLKCEHKYWSRLEQREVIDELPNFGIVDLDREKPEPPPGIGFPMWLKPVKPFSAELVCEVDGREEFDRAVREFREGAGRAGDSFDYVLNQVELPAKIADAGGEACLAEEALHGVRAVVEGYVHNGEVVIYGALDSIGYEDSSSVLRHQYPSRLPEDSVRRMQEIAEAVMGRIGYDNATFSIEFFCHPVSGQVCLLAVDPRHAQSHAGLFELVDGVASHEIMVRLGLGENPRWHRRRGRYEIAGKWYLRRFSDAVVTRVPTRGELATIQNRVPGTRIEIVPAEGRRLSDLPQRDGHSFELAQLFVAASTEEEMCRKYDRCVDALRFGFAGPGEEPFPQPAPRGAA